MRAEDGEQAVEIGVHGAVISSKEREKRMRHIGSSSWVAGSDKSAAPSQHSYVADFDARGNVAMKKSDGLQEAGLWNSPHTPNFWNRPALMQAFEASPTPAPGQLKDKEAGYCVDEYGHGLPSTYREVHNENQCWDMCQADETKQACAYHYDTNHCVLYVGPAAKANGFSGFYCRMKHQEPHQVSKHPCASTCPDSVVPTCSIYQLYVQPGGCAQHCPEEVKAKYEAFLCGRKPACAATCPENMKPTCEWYNASIANGTGCASTCSEEVKLEFKNELCGIHKPACAETCPDEEVPSCGAYNSYVGPGGCAASCSEAVKNHYAAYVCGKKPLCAGKCPDDIEPTCVMTEEFIGQGGCAEGCPEKTKLIFKTEVCGMVKPACAATCPDEQVPSCSVFNTFMSPGGCGENCTEAVKEHYAPYVCGRVPLCAATCSDKTNWTCDNFDELVGEHGCAHGCSAKLKGKFKYEVCNPLHSEHIGRTYLEARPECAKECHDDGPLNCAHYHVWTAEGGCASSCSSQEKAEFQAYVCGGSDHWGGQHTDSVEEEEKKLEKLDKVIVGAEAMAGYPDSIHTKPPHEEEDPDLNQKRAMVAFCLCCLCCGWCCACFWFHKWALTKKKQKLMDHDAGYEGETDN